MVRPAKASNATSAKRRYATGAPSCLDYSYAGQSPAVKQQIVDMAINASGIRDTARVLHVSPTTVGQIKQRYQNRHSILPDLCNIN
jgi:transposase-like protein